MLKNQLNILEENEAKDNQIIPLQKRINESLYASFDLSEVDSSTNFEDFVFICGENSLDIHPQERLPDIIQIYQPYEVEQILLPDNANCLAVQAYLKMCNLKFCVENKWNAEYMSPTSRVPVIKCGASVVSDFDNIVNFISSKGSSLSENLSSQDKANLRAFMSLVNNVLYYAELYICWYDDDIYNNITRKRHGCAYPWPLNHYLTWQKRNQVIKKLNIFYCDWKSLDQVFEDVKKCCESLSERLSDKMYFFGDNPNELDALIYSHIRSLITSKLPFPIKNLASIIRRYPNLIEHNYLIHSKYFKSTPNLNNDSFDLIETSSDESIMKAFEIPNELDALVFGHLFSILTTSFAKDNDNTMAKLVRDYPRLTSYCRRIEDRYFQHDEE